MRKFDLEKILASLFAAPAVGDKPPTVAAARALTDRYTPGSLLPYRAWDSEYNGCLLNEGNDISFGFGFELVPLILAGRTTEDQVETLINLCRPGTSVMFALLSNDDIHHQVNAWLQKRLANPNQHPMLREMAIRRAQFMLECVKGNPLAPGTRLYARNVRAFAFFRVPFPTGVADPARLYEWLNRTREMRQQLGGVMSSIGLHPRDLNGPDVKRLLMQLCNPQFSPMAIDEHMSGRGYGGAFDNFFIRGTRMTVSDREDGALRFTGGEPGRDRAVAFVTVDQYPEELGIQDTRNLTGTPFSREDAIPDCYWLWTAIDVLDPEKARKDLLVKLGAMNKQALSESAWIRSMLGPLMKRRDSTQNFLDMCSKGHAPCRAMTGIMVIAPPERLPIATEYVTGLWRKAGFIATTEKNINLPMFVASLPWGYSSKMDSAERGLQRFELMHTFNAACALPVAADWEGHGIASGGPTLFSRRGQIASINLLESETNYNVTVVADSGAGKSFTMAEFVTTYLSMEGIVRVIDAGASYARLAEMIDGENMVFAPTDRKSMNPLWGVEDVHQLNEEMPTLKELVAMMAYPTRPPDDWVLSQIEAGIKGAWGTAGTKLGLQQVYEWFRAKGEESKDRRYHDVADQLTPYTIDGRYGVWFNGPPQISLKNNFTILELDELNRDIPFRTVILTLLLNMIVRDLYSASNRKTTTGGIIPKLVLIDEAWDLMGAESGRAGKFIEQAARRVRKYNGTLCTITQGYGDYDVSDSARAAFVNAAWRASLKQSGPSLSAAKRMGLFPADADYMWKTLESINRGPGYSEIHFFNKIGDVFRFIVDPFSYFVFTTNPKDKSALQRARDRGMSVLEAVKYCADEMAAGRQP